jgi:hypothetical protein
MEHRSKSKGNKANRMIFRVGKRGLEVEYLPYQKAGSDGKSSANRPRAKRKLPTALKLPKIAILVVPPSLLKELGGT